MGEGKKKEAKDPGRKPARRLFINLDHWFGVEDLKVECSYPYHPDNNGFIFLREWLAFQLVCRKCEEAPCLSACRYEALERPEGQEIKRNNLLCVGCKSCALACPFGTIYFEIIPFLTFKCDLCEGRLRKGEKPLCVHTSPEGAIEYGDFEVEEGKNQHLVGEIIVQMSPWKKS